MSTYGLSAFGLALEPGHSAPAVADRPGEARLALTVLGVALAAIEAIGGATLLDRLPGRGLVLLTAGLLQAAWLVGLRRDRTVALAGGAALNALLLVLWALARTRQPLGIVDALCAADSLAIVAITLALARPRGRQRVGAALSQGAIVLAVASLAAAVAGGHTHSERTTGPPDALTTGPPDAPVLSQFYCDLL